MLLLRSLLIVALGSFFVACGGEDSDDSPNSDDTEDTGATEVTGDTHDITLQEYFDDAEGIALVHSTNVRAVQANLDSSGEPLDVFYAAMSGGREALSIAMAAMNELEPPAEAEDAHQGMVDAGERYLDSYDELPAQILAANSVDELPAPGTGPFASDAAEFVDACSALQEVAAVNDIDADLQCD